MTLFQELPTDQVSIHIDEDDKVEIEDRSKNDRGIALATGSSWLGNWILLILKIFVFSFSHSKAILALVVDSAVDLFCQSILSLAALYAKKNSPDYPVGRSKLEALSIMMCACIMIFLSIEVIQFSMVDIAKGIDGQILPLKLDPLLYTMIVIATRNDMLSALAEDHFNDMISNSGAIITAAIAYNTTAWWFDPGGAILISIVIIFRWVWIIIDQVKKVLGHTAPPHFVDKIEKIARSHDTRLAVDFARVYHIGAKYNVEIEIILPDSMSVIDSHDIALALKQKIEAIYEVERVSINVNHQKEDTLGSKIEPPVTYKDREFNVT